MNWPVVAPIAVWVALIALLTGAGFVIRDPWFRRFARHAAATQAVAFVVVFAIAGFLMVVFS